MKVKPCLVLLFSLLTIHWPVAQKSLSTDSVRVLASRLAGTERLLYLDSIVANNATSTFRLQFAHLLEEEAITQKKDSFLANAYFMLAKHFYVIAPDSLRYFIAKAEPLLLEQGRLEDICRMRAWNIYILNREGEKDSVLDEVEALKKFSNNHQYPGGVEMADQSLADFYFTNDLKSEGERLYLDVLERMQKRNAPLGRQYNIIRQLIMKSPNLESRFKYIAIAEEYIEKAKAQGLTEFDKDNPLFSAEYFIHLASTRDYSVSRDFDQAWKHLKAAEEIGQSHSMSRAKMEIPNVYMIYYQQKGEYNKALEYILPLEAIARQRGLINDVITFVHEKAVTLGRLRRWEESNNAYYEYVYLKDSIDRKDYADKLAEIQTKHQIDKLEFKNKQMEIEAEQNHLHMTVLLVGFFVLIIIVLILTYLMLTIQRSRKALRIAKEKAEEADLMKSAFLANMNHEIRTPLNAIVGFSQILAEEEDMETRKDFANIIQQNNEVLQSLISDVLDISKIESNSVSLVYSLQDVPEIMREIKNTIRLRVPDGIELRLDPCEPFVFETDRNRLLQVLTNLLTNAIKYTQEGYVRFGYELTDTHIKFYIEDSGEGIHEEKIKTIFDRFVQLESGKRGVGLGLAICKGLVTAMKGEIWVTSEVKKGSVFYVSIPKVLPAESKK